MAIGISFYGIVEPLANFTSPPAFTGWEAESPQAAEGALSLAFMHWGLHPYALYTTAGLVCAFMVMNCGRKFQISSSLFPLIGKASDGTAGKIVNSICIFALIGGIGTSLGIGVMQLATGVNYVFGTEFPMELLALVFIVVMAIVYIGAACSGIFKGIKHVSNINVFVYLGMLVCALVFGNLLFTVDNTISSVGKYLTILVPQSFYLEPAVQSGWVKGNTIFYWAWWLSAAPLIGLFLAKLSRGRTIRQFVLMNMLAPTLFAIAWFGIFGSSAINMQMNGSDLAQTVAELGPAVSLFAFAREIPPSALFVALSFICIAISFITLAESMTLTISDMVTKEHVLRMREARGKGSPAVFKIFWGALIGMVAFILLNSGGLVALQTASVVCGLPILILMLIQAAAFVKCMVHREDYDLTLKNDEAHLVEL